MRLRLILAFAVLGATALVILYVLAQVTITATREFEQWGWAWIAGLSVVVGSLVLVWAINTVTIWQLNRLAEQEAKDRQALRELTKKIGANAYVVKKY